MINEDAILNSINNLQPYKTGDITKVVLQYANLNDDFSNYQDGKTIYVVAGPAGSGKSTLISKLYRDKVFESQSTYVPFINRYYHNQKHQTKVDLSQEKQFKELLIKKGKSFVTETAEFDDEYFSFIQNLKNKYGAKICLIYVTKRFPYENLLQIKKRVAEGGHDIVSNTSKPPQELFDAKLNEVKKMYVMDGRNLKKLLPLSDCAFVVRNTTQNQHTPNAKPVILKRKTLEGKVISSDIMKYQIEYNKIIRPNVKMLNQKIYKVVRKIVQKKHISKGYYFRNGKIINKKTGRAVPYIKVEFVNKQHN